MKTRSGQKGLGVRRVRVKTASWILAAKRRRRDTVQIHNSFSIESFVIKGILHKTIFVIPVSDLPCLSCLTCIWYFSPEVITKCLHKWPVWKASTVLLLRELEVVHKQIGGCLISYNLRLACLRKLEVVHKKVRGYLISDNILNSSCTRKLEAVWLWAAKKWRL